MGLITTVTDEYNEDERIHKVTVRTKGGISRLTELNRVAGRAALKTGIGQRTLVAAAAEEENIDIVWEQGQFERDIFMAFPDAKNISYESFKVTHDQRGFLLGDEGVLHVWKIPFNLDPRPP